MSKCRCAVSPIPLCAEASATTPLCAVSLIPPYLDTATTTLSCSESGAMPFIPSCSDSRPKRRVQFAAEHQKLYFHPTRPVFKMKKPMCRIALSPINCAKEAGTGTWLADLHGMRQAPFCRLDYLRVKSVAEEESAAMNKSIFVMDEASCDAIIEGEVAALNLDYKKEVYIHYTLDSWKSQSVAMASYVSSVSTLRIDKFQFIIPLPDSMSDFTLQLAIKYCVGGKIYWDNFNCQNYQFCGTVEEEDGQVLLVDLVDGHETNAVTEVNSVAKPQPIPIPARPSPVSLKMDYSKSATDVPFLGSNRSIPGHAASWTCTKSFTVQAGFTRSRTLTTMPLDGIPFFMA